MQTTLSPSALHPIPKMLQEDMAMYPNSVAVWEDITPLARNEWICWITSAKQEQTQRKRMRVMHDMMAQGKRRPCCWPGCPHREKNNNNSLT
jgi:uncharacterized protein YdeI (YjbR/CyaY-like superfamily)